MERILEVSGLTKAFYNGKTLQTAVNQISFCLDRGETLGIVGESGCGKTTTAKMITRILEAEAGIVRLCGRDIIHARGRELRTAYEQMQMVFQTPMESFNPRMKLGAGVAETMINGRYPGWRHGIGRKNCLGSADFRLHS